MSSAASIAAAIRSGKQRAVTVAEHALATLTAGNPRLRAATRILADTALAEAARVDARIAEGRDPGPLAGVPFGVKDLFDVAGLPTTAGAAQRATAPPAIRNAEAVRRLRAAGAVLVATLNMDEFAYGFSTVNRRHGTTANPHDPSRLSGGSSGGSAAAVAAGWLPLTLGSDTNGSIRVPASLCGVLGLRPTAGILPMDGVFPLAASLDTIGPFTADAADLRLAWNVLSDRPAVRGAVFPRVARLGGRFRANADPAQLETIDRIAPNSPIVELPEIDRARSAAFLLTAAEAGALHRDELARDPFRFDPATRDRLLAGALLPPGLREEALRFIGGWRTSVEAAIAPFDVLLAPATPGVAPPIDDPRIVVDGRSVEARALLGLHTQPLSPTGLPVLSVPLPRPGLLPLGLQLVGRAGGEATLLRYAATLETQGAIGFSPPP